MINERLMQIANHYGLYSQLDILQEECAELIQAVSKYRRGGHLPLISDYQHLVEEIADVEIMIAQVKYLMKIPNNHIEGFKEEKINRQLLRIEEEMKHESKEKENSNDQIEEG